MGQVRGVRGEDVAIGGVRARLWGPASDRLVVAVHGKYSSALDADVTAAVARAVAAGAQVLTFDLPGHGSRPGSPRDLRVTDAAEELAGVWEWARGRDRRVHVFATSLGTWLTMLTAPPDLVASASFLSPVLDLAALTRDLMAAAGVSAEELERRGRIDETAEPLEWEQYRFLCDHPVPEWRVPTRVLRGAEDSMVGERAVRAWCDRAGADLGVVPDAGHHFHTESDLAALRSWLTEAPW